MLVASGVAFYGLMGLFPALAGAVSVYGLISDPSDLVAISRSLHGIVPSQMEEIIIDQLTRVIEGPTQALSAGAIVGLAASMWSANRAVKALFTGLNICYHEREKRNLIQLQAASFGTTVLVILGLSLAFAVVAVLPWVDAVARLHPVLLGILRYGGLGIGMLTMLSLLYRFGPSRRNPRWQWISVGSSIATLVWLGGCVGFSFYVQMFGSYNETFGTLGGVVVLLTWLWISALCVLLGAEINAELEFTTQADTTVGPDRPMGERGAFVADNSPEDTALEARSRWSP